MTDSIDPPDLSKSLEKAPGLTPPDADPPAGGKAKVWRAGTLTYSAAGLAALFFWLLWGDFAAGIKERAIYPMAQIMLRGFQSPDWLVGLLVGSIPAGIGMLWGPVISVMSDRHRGKWGRR
ncbi:MAG: MFS transporter, partial [Verrucomicrobiota bacterium]